MSCILIDAIFYRFLSLKCLYDFYGDPNSNPTERKLMTRVQCSPCFHPWCFIKVYGNSLVDNHIFNGKSLER